MKYTGLSPNEAVWRTLLSMGNAAAIQSILARGMELGGVTEDGGTPLMLAVEHGAGPDVVRRLVAAGVDPTARDRSGRNALEHALAAGARQDVIEALRAATERPAPPVLARDRDTLEASAPSDPTPAATPSTVGETSLRMVADAIVRELKTGVPSWVRPWSASPEPGIPINVTTGRPYSPFNAIWLWSAARERGYTRHAWLTRLQAQKVGASVRAGEKPTVAFHYFPAYMKKAAPAADGGQPGGRDTPGRPDIAPTTKTVSIPTKIPAMKAYLLYNVAQFHGLPERYREPSQAKQAVAGEPAKRLLDGLGADVRHGGDEAFFHRGEDFIQLPHHEQFETPQAYLSTALHEHVHWTGHASRLDRTFGTTIGDERYAFEELLAELATAFLCARFRVDGRFQQSAAYVDHWIQQLSEDPRYLFKAIHDAQGAVDFMKSTCSEAFA